MLSDVLETEKVSSSRVEKCETEREPSPFIDSWLHEIQLGSQLSEP